MVLSSFFLFLLYSFIIYTCIRFTSSALNTSSRHIQILFLVMVFLLSLRSRFPNGNFKLHMSPTGEMAQVFVSNEINSGLGKCVVHQYKCI